MTFAPAHAAYLSATGEACGGVPPSGAQAGTLARPHTHASTSAHASHAERHRQQPVPGPEVPDLRLFVLPQRSARQRLHDAFGAGIHPSLIQSWNDNTNDKVFADSIFGPGVRELRVAQGSDNTVPSVQACLRV